MADPYDSTSGNAKSSVGPSAPRSIARQAFHWRTVILGGALLGAIAGTPCAVRAADLALNWNDNSSNETGFQIERATDTSSFAQIATVSANVTSYLDSGLASNTNYRYRVRAYNDAGASEYSNVASAATSSELLSNSAFDTFENGVAVGWATQSAGGVVLTLAEDAGRTGPAQRISISATDGWGMFFYQQPQMALGKTYVWSFWYKTDGSADAQSVTASATNGSHSETIFDLNLPGTGGTWQYVEHTFIYDNAAADMVRLAAVAPGFYWVDDMSLVEVSSVVQAPPNSSPTISAISDQTIDQNGSTAALAFTVDDAETVAGSLAVTGGSSNPFLVPEANIVFGGSGSSRNVTVTPLADQTGSAEITVAVSDGELTADTTFVLTVSERGAQLVNLSSRGLVNSGDPMIAGFVVGGEGPQKVLIRAVGKSLENFGITDTVGEPVISVVPSKSGTTVVQTENGWDESGDIDALVDAMAEAGAFPLEEGKKDAALLLQLEPGRYTAVVEDSSRKGGICLVEVYALDDELQVVSGQLLNLSTRGYVANGKDVMIGGLVISGNQAQRVLIRGAGPALTALGVSNTVSDPGIQVFASGASEPMASNDNWNSDPAAAALVEAAAAAVNAFSFAAGSDDAALLLDLEPGIYTVHLSPARGPGGTGLVEVYLVP